LPEKFPPRLKLPPPDCVPVFPRILLLKKRWVLAEREGIDAGFAWRPAGW
jgi:hypothetical protein